jgi:malonyl-CoA O-methyltransferase
MSEQSFYIDKLQVRHSFERAAQGYEQAAVLQREVGQRMLERLDVIRLEPKRVVDVGGGTGLQSVALNKRYKKARLITLDISPAMLRQARKRKGWFSKQYFVCADVECLPLANHSIDLIYSNLTVQWCNDLDRTFYELRRILKPDGLLMFSTFGPDTLKELRESWKKVDGYNHVNAFMDMHDIGDALLRAGLTDPVMDVEHITMTYPDVLKLMKDLKTIGAHNVTGGRARGLTGKGRLKAVLDSYESYRRDGVLPATYEVVYGHAWGSDAPLTVAPVREGIAQVPVSRLKGTGRP